MRKGLRNVRGRSRRCRAAARDDGGATRDGLPRRRAHLGAGQCHVRSPTATRITANLTSGSGVRGAQRIRTIGVQAPEVAHNGTLAECGAAQSTQRLTAQLPPGAPVQTRSVQVTSNDDYSGGRIVRSLYGQDEEGNWYDTSRGTVSEGWLMWFPLSADSVEQARVGAQPGVPSAGRRRRQPGPRASGPPTSAGLAHTRTSSSGCGRSTGDRGDLRREQQPVRRSTSAAGSSGTPRSAAYRTLPAGTVIAAQGQPGDVRKVYSGDLNLNNLPADNNAFEGDAVYLMDLPGAALGTGNLRAWFPYPCNPDNCERRPEGEGGDQQRPVR